MELNILRPKEKLKEKLCWINEKIKYYSKVYRLKTAITSLNKKKRYLIPK